ncbi:ABC transporter permease subunit [Rhizobium sp. WYCCWR 11146]|uniref:ABC transporter permease subunit n=1 Tax=Rhizobium sp. WYCCWR 11146 TaxID=2749833 RepID=UPI001FED98A7|nr:hypothetical protein [Rhizobium sp. WYCCWR 11146]
MQSNSAAAVPTLPIPLLAKIPVIGEALFNSPVITYLAIILVGVMVYIYRSTHLGSALQAAGDKPAALDAAGVDVVRTRSVAVLCTACSPASAALSSPLSAPASSCRSRPMVTVSSASCWPCWPRATGLGSVRCAAVRRLPVDDHGPAGGGR